MNFPMDNPIFQFFYWLLNTPGNGGVTVIILVGIFMVTVALTLKWISDGGAAKESDVFTYPTPALHHMHNEDEP